MSKKYIIIVLVVLMLVLAAGGYYFGKTKSQKLVTNTVNPVESGQNTNPYEKTNPFSNMKVNPFE